MNPWPGCSNPEEIAKAVDAYNESVARWEQMADEASFMATAYQSEALTTAFVSIRQALEGAKVARAAYVSTLPSGFCRR